MPGSPRRRCPSSSRPPSRLTRLPRDSACGSGFESHGIPVLPELADPECAAHGISASPGWGQGDLGGGGNDPAAYRAGQALAAIHGMDTEPGADPMADMEDLVRQLMATRSIITCLLPGLEAPVDALTGRLLAAVGAAGPRRQQPVMVHGDFSADQVLVDGPAIRIIDFDRVTTSDPARDLGSFAAVEDIADPAGVGPVAGGRKTAQLIDGYRDAGGHVIAGRGGDLGGLPVVPEQRRPVPEPGQRLAGRHELADPPSLGADRVSWHPPLWKYIDDAGTPWRVRWAWPDKEPGEYLLEVADCGTARRPGSPSEPRPL